MIFNFLASHPGELIMAATFAFIAWATVDAWNDLPPRK